MTDREHEQELTELKIEMESMRTEFRSELKAIAEAQQKTAKSVEGLVEAWKAAGLLVSFVKWAASIVTALGILWAAVTHLGKG